MKTQEIKEKRLRDWMNDYVDNKTVVAVQPHNINCEYDYSFIGTLREFEIGWFSVEHDDTMSYLNFKMSDVVEICNWYSKPVIELSK